ncbi:MAG: helical backbone metal receptor [Armatimonadota bacterium]|nr:helical backbone metal receptor [Armatimonadota bacterium]
MRALICLLLLPLLLPTLLVCGGCRSAPGGRTEPTEAPPDTAAKTAQAGEWPRTFTDDLGAEVTLPAAPQRVVSLAPGFTEAIFAMGADDRLVGRSDFCYFPSQALELPSVGSLISPSIEKIVGLEPDLVLVIRGTPRDVVQSLRDAGVPVIARSLEDLDEVITSMRDLGRYLGIEDRADALAGKLQTRREAVAERSAEVFADARRPDVLFVVEVEPVFAAGPGCFVDDMIRIAGGMNAAAEAAGETGSPWPQLSLEAVVDADPDVIVASLEGHVDEPGGALATLRQRTGWRELTAVREGRVFEADPDLMVRAGPRLIDGLERLAEIIHGVALEGAENG